MKIQLLYASHKPPLWAELAFEEYAKRMPKHYHLSHIRIVPDTPITEAKAFLQKMTERAYIIVLDIPGKQMSTPQVAEMLGRWEQLGKDLIFIIGGPDGIGPALQARADFSWSLSSLTFAHPLARVIWIEQLYRAWSLREGHPYHRE